MNKFIKFAGYLLLIAVLLFAIDLAAGYVFDHYFFLKNDAKLKYAFEGGGGEDIAIIGASRAAHHYVPSIISEETGFSCYNYGMDGRNIFNHYVVEQELLTNIHSRPKLIILETAYIDIEDSPGWNGEKLSNLYALYKCDINVRTIVDAVNGADGVALSFSNLFRYNSSVLSLLVNKLHPSVNASLQGYVPLYAEWSGSAEVVDNPLTTNVFPLKEEYVKKFIQSCNNYGTKLIVYNSPDFRIFKNPSTWEDRIAEICKDYNVPFINHAKDSLFWVHKDWFNEPFHLNDKGAKEYTSIVAKEIKDYITNH